MSHKCLILTNT